MNRGAFENWLKNYRYTRNGVTKGYTQGTINSYANQYIPSISNHLTVEIYNVNTIPELLDIRSRWENSGMDEKTTENYRCALNKYIEFTESL